MNRTKWLVAISLTAVAGMVALVVTYASQVSMLYLKMDEVFARLDKSAVTKHKGPESLVGTYLRIHGHLKPKSAHRYKGRLDYEFHIQNKAGRSIKVRYQGILPDTFRDGAELVLEGKLLQADLFQAYSVFAKCPTKYKEEKEQKKQTS
ncbi:MAG: cytochrome c maturation protein CcmE [Myxococcales bacterium]|nr:cytochrome c maturation protein CcmE [Myxococcales bacterium]